MNKYKIQHFTLLELLLVMGLMALMVSFALPAFSRMAGNNSMDIMASNIKTALEQGQSTAVSRNCYVAVVFPNTTCSGDAKEYAFGGYRLAEVTTEDGETFKFKRWISESYMNKPSDAYLAAVRGSKLKVGTDKAPEAFVNDQLSESVSGLKDGITGKASVIFKPTGESVNKEMYFVIAAGTVSGNTLSVERAEDFRQIKFNPFTGRSEYISDEESASAQTGDNK